MKSQLIPSSSICLVLLALGCSDNSSTAPASSSSKGGSSSTSSSSKGGQTSTSSNSSSSVGGSSSTSNSSAAKGGATGSNASDAQGGATGTNASDSKGGATGTTTAKGGANGTSVAKGGNTGIGGSSSSATDSTPGGKPVGGGAGPKGGNTSVGGGAGPKAGAGSTSVGDGGTAGTSSVTSSPGGTSGDGVTVQLDKTHQTIQGFGINDTWQPIPSDKVAPLFNPTSGIGMSILRIGMNYTSTATTATDYNSNESSNISAAKSAAGSDFKVIGSVWTAANDCRDNNTRDKSKSDYGGHLKTSCYDSWASAIANFAKARNLYAMGVANEPDFVSCGLSDPCNGDYDTMAFTAKEMVAFIKVVKEKFTATAPGVKIISPEQSEWIHLWSNISAGPNQTGKNSSDPLGCGCFGMVIDEATSAKCAAKCASGDGYDYGHFLAADAAAWSSFDIIGTHQYDSQVGYAWPSDVTAARKEVWQTEMSGVKWWPEVGPTADIANGIAVAGWIHSALVVGDASAWIWWWHAPMSGGTNDNEGIWLQDGSDTKRHYTIGNFSKFVRPGYVRVDVNGNSNADLLLSAYVGPDGTVAVVAINKGTSDVTVPITIAGGTKSPTACTPNLTSGTISENNLKAGTAVTVSGGAFNAALVKQSVTTFVCK